MINISTFFYKLLVQIKYYKNFKRFVNFSNPQDLNEKIQWLKFYSDTSLWSLCADKYRVRQFVKEKGYEDILIPLIGKWDNVDDIDWTKLPQQFIMKINNGSGGNLICKNIYELDISKTKNYFRFLLNKRFGDFNVEPHYKSITPCIIAEELLDITNQSILTNSLIDYKIWCFDGKPFCVCVFYNRCNGKVESGTYDLNWNYHKEWSIFTEHYIESSQVLPPPVNWSRMLEIAAKLSEGIPQVRVDLYEVGGKVYFGEMTFTSAGGFNNDYTDEFLLEMGRKITLPLKK